MTKQESKGPEHEPVFPLKNLKIFTGENDEEDDRLRIQIKSFPGINDCFIETNEDGLSSNIVYMRQGVGIYLSKDGVQLMEEQYVAVGRLNTSNSTSREDGEFEGQLYEEEIEYLRKMGVKIDLSYECVNIQTSPTEHPQVPHR